MMKGTYAEELKRKTRSRLIGFAAGSGLGIIAGHFLGISTWKMVLAGGGIGLLMSGMKK